MTQWGKPAMEVLEELGHSHEGVLSDPLLTDGNRLDVLLLLPDHYSSHVAMKNGALYKTEWT